ncbi:molecular chaperone [Burkholderia sp. Ac-20353]|uniref:fimbrial biogenesis chaperone n=1 Tax=Burkholderia sp. Ac-20353 TaxID=2703894 RepID=UPI00197BB1FC|nr:molecular chaperone [Burkholderia sp. Ac-20353]MBN3787163.1 molecular chaperone [Burkholderia sp. Ac-20353]
MRAIAAVAAAAVATGAAGAAHAAASVMIWPIDPVIESDQRAAALWLENRDTKPVTLQVRVLGWREEGGEDLYSEDQTRVAGSPPMTTVPPGKRQLIRLTRTADVAPGTEDAYRVLIDEIPQPDEDAAQAGNQASLGVKFQMHYSIPLFVYGAGLTANKSAERPRGSAPAAQPELSWHVAQDGGKRWLVIANRGAVHARITQVVFDTQGERSDVTRGLLGYVLPGAQMRWMLPDGIRTGAHARLIATINGTSGVAIEPGATAAPR